MSNCPPSSPPPPPGAWGSFTRRRSCSWGTAASPRSRGNGAGSGRRSWRGWLRRRWAFARRIPARGPDLTPAASPPRSGSAAARRIKKGGEAGAAGPRRGWKGNRGSSQPCFPAAPQNPGRDYFFSLGGGAEKEKNRPAGRQKRLSRKLQAYLQNRLKGKERRAGLQAAGATLGLQARVLGWFFFFCGRSRRLVLFFAKEKRKKGGVVAASLPPIPFSSHSPSKLERNKARFLSLLSPAFNQCNLVIIIKKIPRCVRGGEITGARTFTQIGNCRGGGGLSGQ